MLASSGTACNKDFRYSDVSLIEDDEGVFFLLVVSFKLQAPPPPHVSDSSLIFLDSMLHCTDDALGSKDKMYDPKCCLEQLQRKNQLTHSFISLKHNAGCPSHTFLSAIRKTKGFLFETQWMPLEGVYIFESYERSELLFFFLR